MALAKLKSMPVSALMGRLKAGLLSRNVFIAAMALAIWLIATSNDVFWSVIEFVRANKVGFFDDVLTFFTVAVVSLTIAVLLRSRDLAGEIKQRKLAEDEANALARRDALTGLPNRRSFEEELGGLIAMARQGRGCLALFIVDLDRFKPVNDTNGHLVGDEVLQVVATRIRRCVGTEDTVARLGGDEFAIVRPFSGDQEQLADVARRVNEALAEPMIVDATEVDVTASVGIAVYPDDATTAAQLAQKADLAMYKAKGGGRNRYAFYEAGLSRRRLENATLETNLRRAIREKEIAPHYQPLFLLADRSLAGFEVLARWEHPEIGRVAPDVFIPLAERAGVINDLTWCIVRQACEDAAGWPEPVFVAFNISVIHMQDKSLPQRLQAIAEEAGFALSRLEVEITESALVADFNAAKETIATLKALGIHVVLDDFGTGYSSLRYLSELPFDKVKIDRRFIAKRRSNPKNERIVASIIGLARSLGLSVVAEGVESEEDAAWLQELGCQQAQGYLFSPAMSADQADTYITRRVALYERLDAADSARAQVA